MKRLIIILPLLSLIVISCKREPYAEAYVNFNPVYVGEFAHFSSYTTNSDYVEWDMGDGTVYTNSAVDHFFMDPGYYDVNLRAYGGNGGVSTARIPMEVIGSAVTIEVREFYDEYLIPEVEIFLFRSLEDWDNGDINLAIGPFYTDNYGQVTIEGLSYQRYYVDAFYRVGNEGYVNWNLGLEDVVWIETQLLHGLDDYLFVAYVDAVIFDAKKAADAEAVRKGRIPNSPAAGQLKSTGDRPFKENKITIEGEKR